MDLFDDLDAYADGGRDDEQDAAGQQLDDDGQATKPNAKRVVQRKPRPKLTVEHLKAPTGLADVFENFPRYFAAGYRGHGHEVRDLRRLLELYQRWQARVFPHGSYDAFEVALEKLSGCSTLKNELHLMRQDLWDKVQPPGTAAGPQLSGGEDDALQQQDAPPHQPDQQPQRYDELDDDELLELQAEAMDVEAAAAAAEEAVPEAFDEHLPASMPPQEDHQQPPQPQPQVAATSGNSSGGDAQPERFAMRDWSDDDSGDERHGAGFKGTTAAAGTAGLLVHPHARRSLQSPEPRALSSSESGSAGAAPSAARPRLRRVARGGSSAALQPIAADTGMGDSDDDVAGSDAAELQPLSQQQRQQQHHQQRNQRLVLLEDSDSEGAAAPTAAGGGSQLWRRAGSRRVHTLVVDSDEEEGEGGPPGPFTAAAAGEPLEPTSSLGQPLVASTHSHLPLRAGSASVSPRAAPGGLSDLGQDSQALEMDIELLPPPPSSATQARLPDLPLLAEDDLEQLLADEG